jgi:hypothetical protein
MKKQKGLGPHIVNSRESVLYKKHHDQKSLSKRLTASGAYLFQSKINGSASFYSPDKVTSLLIDDLKSRSAELNAMVASLPLVEQMNLLNNQTVLEVKALLKKEGIRFSEKRIKEALFSGRGFGSDPRVSGLIAGYSFIQSDFRLPFNRPEDLTKAQKFMHNGLDPNLLNSQIDQLAMEEAFVVLKKGHLDPYAKIALISFFYIHSGAFCGDNERFLYLLISVLIQDGYSLYFSRTLARHLSANRSKIQKLYEATVAEKNHADLDHFVYGYCKMLCLFLDQEILSLRRAKK